MTMKRILALVLCSLGPLAAETLQLAAETLEMDKPIAGAASGLEVTVMANPVGTIPILAQYAPRPKAGIMVLIKNSTAQPDTDAFLVGVSYRDGDKTRLLQTVIARTSGVNANYSSAIVWIEPGNVLLVTISQAKTLPLSVQFGPTAQFEILGDDTRLQAPAGQ